MPKKVKKSTTSSSLPPTSTKDIDDNDLDTNSYSGTFRWKASKKLPSLPPLDAPLLASYIDYQHGWKGYFLSRQQQDSSLMQIALQDLSLVDCLSFVNSILYLVWEKNILHLELIDQFKQQHAMHVQTSECLSDQTTRRYEKLRFYCIGCSSKAEERILRETNAFQELLYVLYPIVEEIELWFIGPELSMSTSFTSPLSMYQYPPSSSSSRRLHTASPCPCQSTMTTHLFQGTAMDFFRSYPHYMNIIDYPSLLIGFNCGFGNFENPLPRRYDLFYAWYYDLCFLTSLSRNMETKRIETNTETATMKTQTERIEKDSLALSMIFFCANDYADLFGELVLMMKVFGMKLIVSPSENPFAFASTMIPPGSDGSQGEYARGNAFYYAIQGFEKERRLKLYSPPHPSQRQEEKHKNIVLASVIPIFQSISEPQLFFDSLSSLIIPGRLCPRIKHQEQPVAEQEQNESETIISSAPLLVMKEEDTKTGKLSQNLIASTAEVIAPSVQELVDMVANDLSISSIKKEELLQEVAQLTFDSICEVVESVDFEKNTISLSLSHRNNTTIQIDLKSIGIDLHSSGNYILLSCIISDDNKSKHKLEKKIDFFTNPAYQCLFQGKDLKKTQVSAKYSKKKECLQVNIVFQ
jgi:hypothetical protein